MRLRTGIDLLEISRMKKSASNPRFLVKVFGGRELAQYLAHGEKPSFLAANFCAKEAFAKALGTGVRGFSLHEVQVLRDDLGRPFLALSGSAARLAQSLSFESFDVSLSHTKDHAIAVVIAYCEQGGDTP